jgi:hypothetical protein
LFIFDNIQLFLRSNRTEATKLANAISLYN